MSLRNRVRTVLLSFPFLVGTGLLMAQPQGPGPRFGPQGPGMPQGPRFGPQGPVGPGPGFPGNPAIPGPQFVDMYRCSKCSHEFSSPTKPSRCPKCNTMFTFVTDSTGKKTVSPERNLRNTYVIGAICLLVSLAVVGGGVFLLVKLLTGSGKTRKRRRVSRPVYDDRDDHDDDDDRRRRRDDDNDDDRPRRRRRDS